MLVLFIAQLFLKFEIFVADSHELQKFSFFLLNFVHDFFDRFSQLQKRVCALFEHHLALYHGSELFQVFLVNLISVRLTLLKDVQPFFSLQILLIPDFV